MTDKINRPEWVPEDADSKDGFTSNVMPGITSRHDGTSDDADPATVSRRTYKRPAALSIDDCVQGVLDGDRTVIARAITLVESNAEKHQERAQEMLTRLLPHAGNSIRIGITGVPGAGKSSLIETLGTTLCDRGEKIAVLAVDPSSSVTGGSILGDKTRMEKLSRNKNAFIRPSPSGGALGGVARKSRETMVVCEAAGYDTILVETVGVGQSEITVRSMVDMFILVQIAGAGDELQGIKKGVMERSDMIVVNKADGDNKTRAQTTRAEYAKILHYLQPSTEGWESKALACSAVTGEGLDDLWETIKVFETNTRDSGVFTKRRQQQNIEWVNSLVQEYLNRNFYNNPAVREQRPVLEHLVTTGQISPTKAAMDLFKIFEGRSTGL
ncbi:MAG: methylmalonyl Co-A mutase-associated GTPase MeaB [Planctomycetota bacterium]|nr:MAG: methylmalonyl Co-A mutase-associated GTPase MeaB [Planctomycetota bacterium]